MIVKVQIFQASSDDKIRMLIYDEPREIMYECDLTDDMKTKMKGRPKAYFSAGIVYDKLHIGKEVNPQNW